MRTTAGSRILGPFVPPYESTVSANLLRDGAIFLGKANMDEFAMGSSNMTSAYRAGGEPVEAAAGRGTRCWCRGVVGRLGGGGGGAAGDGRDGDGYRRLDPPAGVVLRHRGAEADLWAVQPVGRGGVRIIAGPSRAVRAHRARIARSCSGSMAGHDPKDSTSADVPVPDYAAACARGVKGLRIGVPREYRADGMPEEIEASVAAGRGLAARRRGRRSSMSRCRTRNTGWRRITSWRRRRRRPTWRAMTACGSGCGRMARICAICMSARAPTGFGAEVRRRMLIGTYVLSAGYYDAYYLRAQKVRALILRDFTEAFAQVDALLTPTAPSAAFAQGENMDDPIKMYLNDVFTVPADLAGVPAIRCRRDWMRTGCRWACR